MLYVLKFHLEDLTGYFLHSLDCQIHLIIPAIIVVSILAGLVLYQARVTRSYTVKRSWVLRLFLLFVLLWLVDIPAVLGRCPDFEAPPLDTGEAPEIFIDTAGLVFGLTSGLITFLSPCGLPPLPAYISFFLGAKSSTGKGASLGLMTTSGFVLAIVVFGAGFLLLRNYFVESYLFGAGETLFTIDPLYLELLEMIAGIIALIAGITMVFGLKIPFFQLGARAPAERSIRALFVFSILWGAAAVACSPYAFFPIVLYAIGRGGAEPFVGYAVGMAFPVLVVSTMLGAGRGTIVKKLVKNNSKLQKIGGLILVAMGIYIIWYTYRFISPYFVFSTEG